MPFGASLPDTTHAPVSDWRTSPTSTLAVGAQCFFDTARLIPCIHPVKAVAMSDMMVAFHGDHLEKVFHTERSEGEWTCRGLVPLL